MYRFLVSNFIGQYKSEWEIILRGFYEWGEEVENVVQIVINRSEIEDRST